MALHGTGPLIGESDWRRLVVASLKELNANVTMMPGAKLRQQVVEAGLREGLDVAAAIAGDGRSFLQAVAAVDGVVVTRVPGSDAFVGLGGAKPPDQIASASPAALDGLRSDVYRAFTRVASVPFVYQPERDLFSPEDRAEGASVPVPRVDLPYLIELRRKFALQVPPQQQQPLDHGRCEFTRIAKRVLHDADESETSGHDGVHLLIAHEGNSGPFHRDLRDRCYRLVWLPPHRAKQYGQASFGDLLCGVLQFERTWRKSVRPTMDSPLLLPEKQFSAEPTTKNLWSRAFRVCKEKDEIQAVKLAIARFRKRHYRQRSWRDVNGLLFRLGERHGSWGLPSWRRRKFTFHLPVGHHFDVRHERDRTFEMAGTGGTSRHRIYANVDAYGYVRGGK